MCTENKIKTRKILVVDDSDVNQEILRRILEEEYTILLANNGQEAFTILEREQGQISAILLDIFMPVMNGYEFLEKYKRDNLYNIPIIVETTNENVESELKALSYGVADYFTKPYNVKIVRQRLKNLIELSETSRMINEVEWDPLTGVYSKEIFYHKAHQFLLEHRNQEFDVLCMDIENFKMVNDMFGFDVGDKLLKLLADDLREHAKNRGIVGRVGADVFAVVFPHAEQLDINVFRQVVEHMNQQLTGLSIMIRSGIYVVEDYNLSVNTMCDRAILALETIKGKYEEYVAFYDEKIREQLILE